MIIAIGLGCLNRFFMKKTDTSESAQDFIEQNKTLLDSNIMMTHYSADVLFFRSCSKNIRGSRSGSNSQA